MLTILEVLGSKEEADLLYVKLKAAGIKRSKPKQDKRGYWCIRYKTATCVYCGKNIRETDAHIDNMERYIVAGHAGDTEDNCRGSFLLVTNY